MDYYIISLLTVTNNYKFMKQKNYFSIVRATLLALLVTFGFQRLNAQVSYDANVETYTFDDKGYNASVVRNGDLLISVGGTEMKSSYTGQYRFEARSTSWSANLVDQPGLHPTSGAREFAILGLHSGDKIKIEYQRKNDNDDYIKLKSADFLSKSVNNAPETETYQEEVIGDDGSVSSVTNTRVKILPVDYDMHGYEEYFCVANGSLIVNVHKHTSINKITIWSWNYADYEIVPVNNGQGTAITWTKPGTGVWVGPENNQTWIPAETVSGTSYGYTFRFTSSGLHVDKHAAVPFMTMQFGSDDYKTIVSN